MATTTPSYYELLSLTPSATSLEIEAAFRKFVARYRVNTPIERVIDDKRFHRYLNAYLTLKGPLRSRYNELLRPAKPSTPAVSSELSPAGDLTRQQKQLLLAHMAIWRREMVDAIHILRRLLETDPRSAEGWALLGEVFFITHRLDEGINAYEHAIQADPRHTGYPARLQHAVNARDGKVELYIEPSPEEILLREARRKRRGLSFGLLLLGALVIVFSYLLPITPYAGSLFIAWKTVAVQFLGIFTFIFGLSYGKLLRDFEEVMVWSSVSAGDRGTIRQLPYGLLLLITSLISLVLATLTLLIMAFMDEEWPISPSIMIGICVLTTVVTTICYIFSPIPLLAEHWTGAILVGGNALVPAAMLGWWFGGTDTAWTNK